MKSLILLSLVLLLSFSSFSQNDDEKVVRIKLIQEIDGKTVEIDTVFSSMTDAKAYLSTVDSDKNKNISIDVFVDKKLDNAKHDKIKMIIKTDDNDSIISESIFIYSDDSLKTLKFDKSDDKKLIFITEYNDTLDLKNLDKSDHKKLIFIAEDSDSLKIINLDKSDDNNFIFISNYNKDLDIDSNMKVKIVVINGDDKDLKKIKKKKVKLDVIIEEDDDIEKIEKIIIISDDNKNKNNEKFVWVYKNNSQKTVIVLSSISADNFDVTETSALKKQGIFIDKENDLKLDNLTIKLNKNNKFSLNFDVNKKDNLAVKIVDLKGNEILRKEANKFKGNFNSEFDLPKDIKDFVLQIKSGKKIAQYKMHIER